MKLLLLVLQLLLLPMLILSTSCISSGTIVAAEKDEDPTFTQQWKNDFTTESDEWIKAGVFTFDESNAVFTPSSVTFEDGICQLTIAKRTDEDHTQAVLDGYDGEERPYNAAEYTMADSAAGEMYGKFSSLLKVAAPPGVVASFFLAYYDWNDDYSQLLESSEIDIEFCGTTKEVEFALHYTDNNGVLHSTNLPSVSLNGKDASDEYHLWEIEWLPTSISFYMDGEKLHTFTDKRFLDEMEFPMKPDINYWVTKQDIWNVGTLDTTLLPIVSRYDYISYSSWDQSQ